MAVGLAGGLVQRLAERRVRVDRRFDLLVRRFQVDRQSHLRDEFRRLRADDVRAEHLAVRLAEKDLRKPVRLADRRRLAARQERELAHPVLDPLFLRGTFRQALRWQPAAGSTCSPGTPLTLRGFLPWKRPSMHWIASQLATCASQGGPMMSPAAYTPGTLV